VTDQQRSPEEIREDIEDTREELGDTAAALAQKADVKEQAKAKAADAKQKLTERAESLKQAAAEKTPDSAGTAVGQARGYAKENPGVLGAGAAFLVGFLLGRRRSRR
jgi:ElaB/YqjD/DUF883 family membrane-anchored ribosome-binding protein